MVGMVSCVLRFTKKGKYGGRWVFSPPLWVRKIIEINAENSGHIVLSLSMMNVAISCGSSLKMRTICAPLSNVMFVFEFVRNLVDRARAWGHRAGCCGSLPYQQTCAEERGRAS